MFSDDIYSLIAGKLNGELSPEEAEHFQQWMEESEAHRKLFHSYELLWKDVRTAYKVENPDVEKAYREFVQQCQTGRKIRMLWLRYAAAVVIPVFLSVCGWFIYQSSQDKEIPLMTVQVPVKSVQLKFSDGKVCQLIKDQNRIICLQDEVEINQEGNTLKYKSENESQPVTEELNYNTLIVPRGAHYSLILSDGSRVFLNADSEFKYPVRFGNKNRKVYLKGEAYFDVTKDAERPFEVEVKNMNVKVLGTSFNVMAYDNEKQVETTLEAGRVEVMSNELKIELKPGMQAVYQVDEHVLSAERVNTRLFTSWKDDEYLFEKLRLEDLLEKLERWYDVTFFYVNPEAKDIELTGSISMHEEVGIILQLLETMGHVKFVERDGCISVIKR